MNVEFTICIPTFNRHESLTDILHNLGNFYHVKEANEKLRVLVIDNSENASAYCICDLYKDVLNLKYIHEKKRGLSSVRNAAINEVKDNCDLIVFLDDDETPEPGWLNELLKQQFLTKADCVYGPVIPVLPKNAPKWIKDGRFFDMPCFNESNPLLGAGAGNLLISCDFLRRTNLRFDERLNFTGGEDTYFIRKGLRYHGMKIVGAPNAIVREQVAPERLRFSWLLQRKFRIGNGLALFERMEGLPIHIFFVRAIKGTGRIVAGLTISLVGLLAGKVTLARGLIMVSFGLGMLCGLMGSKYEEYAYNNNLKKIEP